MKRDAAINDRLLAWAESKTGGYGGYKSPLSAVRDGGFGTHESKSKPPAMRPLDTYAARETERAIETLPINLRQTVHAWYRRAEVLGLRGRLMTMEEVARNLGIRKSSLHNRLCQVDVLLRRVFDANTELANLLHEARRKAERGISPSKPKSP